MIKIARDKIQFCCDICSEQSLVVYDKSFNESREVAKRIGWVCTEEAGGRSRRVDICPVCYGNSKKEEVEIGKNKRSDE